ncbi:Rv3235 family protein [Rhodococcus sp. NPDC056743]|uniref:Rv3235 family protein n=1 Tax=Rhodococcus sp. NPDC056743 TaxID=3345934 RepID=UPI003670A499
MTIDQHVDAHCTPQRFLRPAPQSEPPADSLMIRRLPARTERVLGSARKTAHSGTSGHGAASGHRAVQDRPAAEPVAPGADVFWNTSLRLVLEVLDRKRNPAHLKRVLSPTVMELVQRLALSHDPLRGLGAARTHKTHVSTASPHAAEVCATYTRGSQTFAIAAKIENTDNKGWMVTALHVV